MQQILQQQIKSEKGTARLELPLKFLHKSDLN